MVDARFQVGRQGVGFTGEGQDKLADAIDIVRARLKRMEGKFTIKVGDEEKSFPRNRSDTLDRLAELAKNSLQWSERVVIEGSAYDEPGVLFRKIKDAPEASPLIVEGRKYLGLPYVFAQVPQYQSPTAGGDCSGFTLAVVRTVEHKELPHAARLQWDSDMLRKVDRGAVESGDFVFYDYPRSDLPSGEISHVALVVDPGELEIGFRPSTDGGGYCQIDWPFVVGFKRLK